MQALTQTQATKGMLKCTHYVSVRRGQRSKSKTKRKQQFFSVGTSRKELKMQSQLQQQYQGSWRRLERQQRQWGGGT